MKRPRTPAFWPRMKVRGRRRRRLVACRIEHIFTLAGVVDATRPDSHQHEVTFLATTATPSAGLVVVTWTDGYGRPVKPPTPEPKPAPAASISMDFVIDEKTRAAWDLLFDFGHWLTSTACRADHHGICELEGCGCECHPENAP
ncbi:hypothetical protein MN032_10955 [Agromyces atrinae]|uniref:hypothetical protein n=1 Tax=Agromyces atrinae TaxID=592376 RepID=UPI001F56CE71|nr:hypothetical protein [Agromyces atrinae]MCI2958216.1 hypothetical protein [Agromyces atrinae]